MLAVISSLRPVSSFGSPIALRRRRGYAPVRGVRDRAPRNQVLADFIDDARDAVSLAADVALSSEIKRRLCAAAACAPSVPARRIHIGGGPRWEDGRAAGRPARARDGAPERNRAS